MKIVKRETEKNVCIRPKCKHATANKSSNDVKDQTKCLLYLITISTSFILPHKYGF